MWLAKLGKENIYFLYSKTSIYPCLVDGPKPRDQTSLKYGCLRVIIQVREQILVTGLSYAFNLNIITYSCKLFHRL